MDTVLRNKTELMNLAKFGLGYLNMGLVAPPFGGLEGLKKLFRLNTIRNGSRISEKMRQII